MSDPAADLARRLAREAEAVCRRYLSNGRRQGRYWIAGDVTNTPGRSLYVRLHGPDSGPGAAGKWTDAATGEHGDLLDLIALNRGLGALRGTLDEAISLLEADTEADSASWFGLSERLHQAGRRFASAVYCLREWLEPDDSQPDSDDDAPYGQRARRHTYGWDSEFRF